MDKLIITAALTGAELTREQQPALPINPEDIANAAEEAAKAGAAMVHVHARLDNGQSTQSPEVYQNIINAIGKRCDVIVQLSTGGAVGMTAAERIAPLSLKPEMATLSMGTVNFGDDVFLNTPDDMAYFLAQFKAHGVVPEFEIFDSGMLSTLQRWIRKGLINTPLHVDFVLGVNGGMAATAESLMFLRAQLPDQCRWTVAGIGAAQLPMSALGIVLGGHVRVGFEDNIYFRKGELATSNAQLVARVAHLAQTLERPLATPDEARQMLGIKR